MQNEIGIAGWLFSQEILRDKTMTQLEMLDQCAAYGVRTVELCSAFFPDQTARYLNEIRAKTEEHGLSIRNIAVDMGNVAGANEATRRTDIETLKQWFYTASAIGSKAIRVNTGSADDADGPKRVIEAYTELAAVGESAGVKLLMENHGGLSARPNQVRHILDGVSTEWFGSCPDTANFETDDWNDGMAALAPRAFSCHVKVFSHSDDGVQSMTNARTGATRSYNIKRGLEILRDAGYGGPLCVERAAPPSEGASTSQGFPQTMAYLRDMMASV